MFNGARNPDALQQLGNRFRYYFWLNIYPFRLFVFLASLPSRGRAQTATVAYNQV